jgi:hypothetical protein
MNLESLRICRNVLLRTFVIGLGVALLYGAATLIGWRTWSGLLVDRWHLVDAATARVIVVAWFAGIRFFLVFVLLVPALALHWTLKREERRVSR